MGEHDKFDYRLLPYHSLSSQVYSNHVFSHSLSSQVYSNAWAAKKLRGGSGPECKAAGWEERRARLGTFNYVKTMCGTK
jgi:hypothetical protein